MTVKKPTPKKKPTPAEMRQALKLPATTLAVAAWALSVGTNTVRDRARTSCAATGRGEIAPGIPVIKVGGRYSVPCAPLRKALCMEVAA